MDKLKTKLQVKSFITKKIINEINRKIGLNYLLEKNKQESQGSGASPVIDFRSPIYGLSSFSPGPSVLAQTPAIGQSPTPPQPPVSWQVKNLNMPTAPSLVGQHAAAASTDLTALTSAGQLLTSIGPLKGLARAANAAASVMKPVNFGVQAINAATLNPSPDSAAATALAALGALYRSPVGSASVPSGRPKRNDQVLQLVDLSTPGQHKPIEFNWTPPNGSPKNVTLNITAASKSVAPLIGKSPLINPDNSLTKQGSDLANEAIKLAMSKNFTVVDQDYFDELRRKGKIGLMSPGGPNLPQDNAAAAAHIGQMQTDPISAGAIQAGLQVIAGGGRAIAPSPSGMYRPVAAGVLMTPSGFPKATDPVPGPNSPLDWGHKGRDLGSVSSANSLGYNVLHHGTNIGAVVGAIPDTVDNQGNFLTNPVQFSRGLPVELQYDRAGYMPDEQKGPNPKHLVPRSSGVLAPWMMPFISPDEKEDFYKNQLDAQEVTKTQFDHLRTDPTAGKGFWKP